MFCHFLTRVVTLWSNKSGKIYLIWFKTKFLLSEMAKYWTYDHRHWSERKAKLDNILKVKCIFTEEDGNVLHKLSKKKTWRKLQLFSNTSIEMGLFNELISFVSTLQSEANQAGDKEQRKKEISHCRLTNPLGISATCHLTTLYSLRCRMDGDQVLRIFF